MAVVLAWVFAGVTVALAVTVVVLWRGRSRLVEDARRGRLGVEHARLHLSVLSRAGDQMAGALESYDDALDHLVDVVVPAFADWFSVHLVDESGQPRRVVAAERAQEGPAVRLPDGVSSRHPDAAALVGRVFEAGRDEVFSATRPHPPHRGALSGSGASSTARPAPGVESMLIVPVQIRGLTLGVLSFVTGPGRRGYRRSDLEIAHGLAERVAVAVERVLLWRESREAERAAVARADQLHRLMEAALAVNAPLVEPEILRVLADHARRVLHAQRASVCTLYGAGVGAPAEARTGLVGASQRTEQARRQDEAKSRARATQETEDDATTGPSSEVFAVLSTPTLAPHELRPLVPAACRVVARTNGPLRSTPTKVEGVPEGGAVDALQPPGPDEAHWLAVPVSGPASDKGRRVIVVEGSSSAPFGPEDESVLVLLAQIASVALMNAYLFQEVRESERRLSAVVESSPLAIAELAPNGEARWWNHAAESLFGGAADGAVRGRIALDARSLPAWHELLRRSRGAVPFVGIDLKSLGSSGQPVDLSVSTAPLLGQSGEVTGIVVVAEDVTEQRHVLDQMHQSERFAAMARLAGGMAHDFNNLLTVILGASDLLASRRDLDDAWREDIESIRRAGQRAAALTAQLLEIGRVRSRRSGMLDPDATLGSIRPMLESALGSGVRLEFDPAPGPVRITVDETDFERAIVNLAINARDAMPRGGRFVLRTRAVASPAPPGAGHTGDGERASGSPPAERSFVAGVAAQGRSGERFPAARSPRGAVAISASDTGEGMDEQAAQHCFEPFFTTKEDGRGTGLGLFVVQAIVTQAGGRVTVDSTRGRGTTFTMLFPPGDAQEEGASGVRSIREAAEPS